MLSLTILVVALLAAVPFLALCHAADLYIDDAPRRARKARQVRRIAYLTRNR